MKVILGGNSFIDCQTLLAYQGRTIVRVLLDPIRVALNTPNDVAKVRHLIVDEKSDVHPADAGHAVAGDRCFAFIANDVAVIVAILVNQETVHLRLELRPFGMNIYDDVNGLHIGGNAFRGNEIRNAATAINLG